MWQALGQVTSALTLVAFAIAAVIALVRRRLISREHQLLTVPKGDRAALVQSLNDSFLIPSLPIDPQRLPEDKAFTLLLEQIRERSRRYYVTSVLVLLLSLIAAAVAAFAIYMQQPRERGSLPTKHDESKESNGAFATVTNSATATTPVPVDTAPTTTPKTNASQNDVPSPRKELKRKVNNVLVREGTPGPAGPPGDGAKSIDSAPFQVVMGSAVCGEPCEARFSQLHPSLYEISRSFNDGRTTINMEQVYPIEASWPIPLYVHVHFKNESDRPYPSTTITKVILSDSKMPGAGGEVCPWSDTACTVIITGYRVSIQGGNWPPDLSIVVRKVAG